jgi:hypothetical protein
MTLNLNVHQLSTGTMPRKYSGYNVAWHLNFPACRAARLRGFEEDLHLKGSQFSTLLSILYVGYILMQIPS